MPVGDRANPAENSLWVAKGASRVVQNIFHIVGVVRRLIYVQGAEERRMNLRVSFKESFGHLSQV